MKTHKNLKNGVKNYKDHGTDEMHTTQLLQMTNTWKLTMKTTEIG